ncbi:MAG: glutathione S-transferase family protein [Holosporales bacterium]|jgi:glutathione S-transferase|nr:glutathione S-transferase family protein [Holosporales bacterium]
MRKLFHYPLCALSRSVRFTLAEKKLDFETVQETPWSPSYELLDYSIFGTLPVLIDISGTSIPGCNAIIEYLDEVYTDISLIGSEPIGRAESRRIVDWFEFTFYADVYKPIITEKILKRFMKNIDKTSDPATIRSASGRLTTHMEYVSWLIDRRNWLAGRDFSIADICAASFISVLDYLGIISWQKFGEAKEWYAKIKSRPGFRGILKDNLPQILPSADYANLDF